MIAHILLILQIIHFTRKRTQKSIPNQEYMQMDITLKKKQEKEIRSIIKWLVSLKEIQKYINVMTTIIMF